MLAKIRIAVANARVRFMEGEENAGGGENSGGENAGGENGGSNPPSPPPPPPPTSPPPPPPPTTNLKGTGPNGLFTPQDVERIMADNRRGLQSKLKTLEDQYRALSQNSALTEKQRNEYAQKVEELQQQTMSKEELAKQNEKKWQQRYDTDVKKYQAESQTWQQRYEDMLIGNDLMAAATDPEHKAFNPKQIAALLRPNTRKVENVDDEGKPNGTFSTRVKIEAMKDGKPVILDLSAKEAVKWMSEQPDSANLFIDKATTGLGGTNGTGSGVVRTLGPNTSMSEYRKNREKYLDAASKGNGR